MKRILLFLLMSMLAVPAFAADQMPGEGVKVQPARATWNTGYFQEALVRDGLKELGYDVADPKELQNPLFYQSVMLGDVDYWTNGWFPNHVSQMPKGWQKRVELVGYVVKSGGLQGYLVSKRDVEKFGIKSLDDFKRPEVKKAFDANGDGKADLTACPPGWGCEKVISYHMKVYDLKDDINPIKAGYAASMADTLARYKSGEPVFFYTWAPNWTIAKLKPGKDVMWINVPKIMPLDSQKAGEDRMTVSGVVGEVTDPLKAGFVVSDIRVVANKQFLEKNPAAKKFFEVFALPLSDINAQNNKMQDGEKSQQDIERHAREWISANQDKWNGWLEAAREAAM
jgi:glycine betaine/proline transport system substrate-binding protein